MPSFGRVIVDPIDTTKQLRVESVQLKDRVLVDTTIAPGQVITTTSTPVPSNPTDAFRNRMLSNYPSGSDSLIVDGSVTPQTFSVGPSATKNLRIFEVRFNFTTDDTEIGDDKFGKGNAISNGVELSHFLGGVSKVVANVKINDDWFDFNSPGGIFFNSSKAKDILVASIFFSGGVVLSAGSTDALRVTIRDDLTANQLAIRFFVAVVYGVEETP